jgi:Zc3h12a-like Ribonuclease NYN domain
MVRPRLVQEGAPIYGPGSDQPVRRVDDHDLDMVDADRSEAAAAAASINKTTIPSLQKAAKEEGLMIPTKRKCSSIKSSRDEFGGGTKELEASHYAASLRAYSSLSTLSHPNHQHFLQQDYFQSNQIDHAIYGQAENTVEMEAEHSHMDHWTGGPVHLPNPSLIHPCEDPLKHNQRFVPGHGHWSHPPVTNIREQPGGPIDKMVGVEHGQKAPLVVLDGANVAHAYGTALMGMYSKGRGEAEPNPIGIDVAVQYFCAVGIRVLVVLPQYWFRSKGGWNTVRAEHEQVLNSLQERGFIVASPPADDDDAYALTIARREEARSLRRIHREGPGFVLSNDMFRDAQARDTTQALRHWLNTGRDPNIGPGRISYSFADMGTINDHGERLLDFIPNPRHPLVIWIENMGLQDTSIS